MSTAALMLAVTAALGQAFAAVFQSRGARAAGGTGGRMFALARSLVTQPVWLVGLGFAGLSGLLHTLALREGSLIEVESVMVTSLLFALVLGSIITDARVSNRDWVGAMCIIVGLVLFLLFADPQDGNYDVPSSTWLLGGVIVVTALTPLLLVARRARTPNLRAAAWGSIAAVVLGSAAVPLKVIGGRLDGLGSLADLLPLLILLIVLEASSLVSQQVAFRAGDLAPALGPFIGGNPVVAGALGIVMFSERFHRDPVDLVGAAIGIAVVVTGIALLAASPTVAAGTGETIGDTDVPG